MKITTVTASILSTLIVYYVVLSALLNKGMISLNCQRVINGFKR